MDTNIITKIAQIREKVKKNVALQKYYEQENKKIQKQYDELQKINIDLTNKITELTEQNKIIKLSKIINNTNTKETTEIKTRINELVREIDKCKTLLNR